MKTFLCLAIATSLLLIGCGEKSDKPAPTTNTASSGSSPLTAPVDYLNAAAKAQRSAVKTVDTTSLTKAVELFNVEHGRNPKDLNDRVQQNYIPESPPTPTGRMLDSDANSGVVKIVKDWVPRGRR